MIYVIKTVRQMAKMGLVTHFRIEVYVPEHISYTGAHMQSHLKGNYCHSHFLHDASIVMRIQN